MPTQMKNTALIISLIVAALAIAVWAFAGNNKLPLSTAINNTLQNVYPTPETSPTPTLTPKSDIDTEINKIDDDLNQVEPNDFNSDGVQDTKLGL